MSEKGSEWIFAGSWNGHACPHPGKVEVGGKWYCGVHDPLTREAKRNAAGEAKLAAQWKAEAIRKQESAEQARKPALWPEIIETLEDGLLQLRHGNGCAKIGRASCGERGEI